MTTMRPRILLTLVLFAMASVLAVRWMAGRAEAERLQAERDALRSQAAELARLQAEQRRLQDALADATHRASPREAAAAEAAPIEPAAASQPTQLVLGEWAGSDTWTNRGQATASAAVETALWAAAGGDVRTLTGLLELDVPTRVKAAELLARLPADAQRTFGSPEGLIAIAAMKAIPLTEAQVVWHNEAAADRAEIGLLLGRESAEQAAGGTSDKLVEPAPPALRDAGAKLTFLTLRRIGFNWRLVVPVSAIDRLARDLEPPKS